MNHTIPINRQAAIFLSRKKRVETVKEALEIFAGKLTEPEVAEQMVQMLAVSEKGPTCLQIGFTIHRDNGTQSQFTVKMRTSIRTDLGEEHFLALK